MAGIGVKLNRLYEKGTLTTDIIGIGYSCLLSVAPMIVVIAAIVIMQKLLVFSNVGYAPRNLFSCTILYIFIFSLLCASPFNSVLSKYISDVIFEEKFDDILPCYYVGLYLNIIVGCLLAIPFCLWEHYIGGVATYYVFTSYFGFIALLLVFYSMLYLSITKDYKKISFYFCLGMFFSILFSLVFRYLLHFSITYSLLLALSLGFMMIASLEYARIRGYFRVNSGKYKMVFVYLKRYWKLIFANFLYTLGLYIHNFVFWTSDLHMIVNKSFVCVQSYDMASCLAMFTNISACVIFISEIEMHFHERYKAYSEAIIGGRGIDIDVTNKRMFRLLSSELMSLVRIQFIITLVIFLVFMVAMPQIGFGGLVLRIYPCLAVGYFILFLMYAEIIFLYYFDDLNGSLITSLLFCVFTFIGSIISMHFTEIWYGLGLVFGAFISYTYAYWRLKWLEKHLNEIIFCKGSLVKQKKEVCPSNRVYDRYE